MTRQFTDALSINKNPDEPDRELRKELRRALSQAENALMQAKMAIALGHLDEANVLLETAGEAHALAQRIRTGTLRKTAA